MDHPQTPPDPVPHDAARLMAAASRLRALATAASTGRSGEPTAHWTFTEKRSDGGVGWGSGMLRAVDDLDDGADPRLGKALIHGHGGARGPAPSLAVQHGEYAAAMDPTVGLALAEWLERAAKSHQATLAAAGQTWASVLDPSAVAFVEHMTDTRALAVADAILAGGGQ